MNKKRLVIFSVLFGLLNLLFVPLLSLYGLRVCPVLSIPGFGFGCYYTGLYIGMVLLFNLVLLTLILGKGPASLWAQRHLFLATLVGYVIASVAALIALQILLNLNHLTSHSRGPEILAFASLLLAITQSYGLNWAFEGGHHIDRKVRSVTFNWAMHIGRSLFPLAVAAGLVLHFLFGQSLGFNDGRTAPAVSSDELIVYTSYLLAFLMSWVVLTMALHFLAEKDQVDSVERHLGKLNSNLDTKYRSQTAHSWGLWLSILEQLNILSKIIDEKTKLVGAFSKFVTAGVAEDVLRSNKLQTQGLTREMTVIMIDIRNFTSLSESLTPDDVVRYLNEYFSAMLSTLSETEIQVDKFIGDGILAYVAVTASAAHENNLAVEAALKMLNRLGPLNERLSDLRLPPVKIGIGIYRGPLVIGLIGTDTKLQHTIIGDSVNRAARLESLSKEVGYSVVISEEIWQSLVPANQARFVSCGARALKGIAEPLQIYAGPI